MHGLGLVVWEVTCGLSSTTRRTTSSMLKLVIHTASIAVNACKHPAQHCGIDSVGAPPFSLRVLIPDGEHTVRDLKNKWGMSYSRHTGRNSSHIVVRHRTCCRRLTQKVKSQYEQTSSLREMCKNSNEADVHTSASADALRTVNLLVWV